MPERLSARLSLRLRFALFFAALGLGGAALIAAALWFGHARAGGAVDGYVIAGLIATLGLLGLSVWIGLLFDENVAKPILALASDLTTRARADVDLQIDESQARHLSTLAPAANAINTALSEARAARQRAVERQTARLAREKALFEALFRDLGEGAVVATPDNRVMLYNRMAQELLGDIGLDRPLAAFLRPEPVLDALARMQAARVCGQISAETFLAASADGKRFLLGRVSPVISDEELSGHVLIFRDATEDLSAHAHQDHLFNSLLEGVRRPAATIGALLDVLQSGGDLPPEARVKFAKGIEDEVTRLFDCLTHMSKQHAAVKSRRWPMSPVAVAHIFDGIAAQVAVPLEVTHTDATLGCDGFAVTTLMGAIIAHLTKDGTREALTLAVETEGAETRLVLGWQGEAVTDGQLTGWLEEPLSSAYGDYSGRDALKAHQTDLWAEMTAAGHRIVLPLSTATEQLTPGDARPEFYDFSLPGAPVGELAERALSDLSFVVFDTETTGLSPRGGDEIVQIAGLRIVNGRILRGETFDSLVNPGRPIPPASTRVHHITDAMVQGAPDIARVGQRFHDFCEGAVLVAHNAPFDLAFLRLKEHVIGRRFDHPVLCTVLMSAGLFDHTGQHTLDALCERFGISIPPEARHTAMGDTIATAEVFVRMLDLLQAKGVMTLGAAIREEGRMTRIRKAQKY
ncbi:DNA polymerase-3 subunit epsilon [Roseovarius azorensis]|uniref:DNA-directed DNA polymerase n=1 Tax=Roseovarius azorensis TaxID=1287727 RepID=A0A1H7VVR7_9RHOB|nr:exonuclease domain-containing protein [Roseovarius azorensis]SEM13422.1 DNA polymerase-3 subunit epsilon [Roseovarius azorensis]